jgi:DNA-binding NtrC family response regulator
MVDWIVMAGRIRVLVVEDNAEISTLFCQITDAIGYHSQVAHTIRGALRLMEEQEFDVLLLDWMMDGDRQAADLVLDRWVQGGEDKPCLIISGYLDQQKICELLSRGAYNAVSKPAEAAMLQIILLRYGRQVMLAQLDDEIANLKRVLAMQRRAIIGLALLVAALGGIEIVPRIAVWIGSLI